MDRRTSVAQKPNKTKLDEKGLRSCPFCGSASKPRLFDFDGEPYVPGYEVRCDASGWDGMEERGCGATSGWGETEAEAVEAWNRRAYLAATARNGKASQETEVVAWQVGEDGAVYASKKEADKHVAGWLRQNVPCGPVRPLYATPQPSPDADGDAA